MSEPVSFETFEELLASVARAHLVMSRHRQKVGGLSREELERLKGRPLTATEEAFLQEVQRKGEGGSGGSGTGSASTTS